MIDRLMYVYTAATCAALLCAIAGLSVIGLTVGGTTASAGLLVFLAGLLVIAVKEL